MTNQLLNSIGGYVLALFVFTLQIVGLAHAQTQWPASVISDTEIVTDRPDVTESSTVVLKGSLQIENGLSWTSDHGMQSVDFSESLLRVGILANTELRFVVPDYVRSAGRMPFGTGFEDLAILIKQQLGPLPGDVDLSVILAVSLPSGGQGISGGEYDPFIKLPWSKDLSRGWSIGGMQSIFWNTEHSRNEVWEPTLFIEKQIAKPLDAFLEYVGDYARWGESKQLAHIGAAFKVNATNRLDFHFGFALNRAAPNRLFSIGYSVRFDHLWR